MDYINTNNDGNELRLEFLKDDLVFSNTSFILEYVEKLVSGSVAECIVLDLGAVTHIDSSAVGMLITLKQGIHKMGKRMRLAGLSESVRRIFRFLDISDFINAA
ncbi:MAG: sodium-independent anion transporter [Spirochaetes bacterium]|nr:sodium-independent anion transporter [Spirochaetota bacterium]